jgi:hypothetical protein
MSSKRFGSRAVGLFAASFLAAAISLSVAIAGEFIPGDVNDDGSFDMVDSVVLRRALVGLGPGITQNAACGNGLLDPNEDCDLGELAGQTCEDVGFSFGTLSCGAGCTFDTSGCTNTRFVDNGDGTVSDRQTGLMWEKKVAGSACLHCADDEYPWSPGFEASGLPTESPSIFDWLSTVNGLTSNQDTQSGLAGHSDWRIPTIVELQTILDCSFGVPCIDPVFGPTAALGYWSSSSFASVVFRAWGVGFSQGVVGVSDKRIIFHVRAVRGGLE